MIRFHLLAIILVIVTCLSSKAQGSSKVLEARQGFRDAKMGMPFSAFKGMKPVQHNEFTMRVSEEFFPVEYLKVYERPADSKRLGATPLMHVYYEFYQGRLCGINIVADASYEQSIINAIHEAYGTSSYTPPAINGDGIYIYSWNASTIDLFVANSTHSGTVGKFLIISFNSIPISREIEKERARRKRGAKFNKVNGL